MSATWSTSSAPSSTCRRSATCNVVFARDAAGRVVYQLRHREGHQDAQGASRPPARADRSGLAAYRLATAKERLGSRYLFPRADGQPWRDHDFRNWRRRTFKPAARSALQLGENDATPRPYDLRHTFVSLLIAEGRTIAYVAAQAGHSAEECARTYLHLFDEHQDQDPGERLSAEDAIRAARVRTEYGNDAGAGGA
jgi:integrase